MAVDKENSQNYNEDNEDLLKNNDSSVNTDGGTKYEKWNELF